MVCGVISTTGVEGLTLGGSYISFMMEEGQDRIKATYGDNYTRLQKVKAKYDPDNFSM